MHSSISFAIYSYIGVSDAKSHSKHQTFDLRGGVHDGLHGHETLPRHTACRDGGSGYHNYGSCTLLLSFDIGMMT